MGKYGFNENEIVKTVTDMIDKDGFHKEVVTYGKPEPAPTPVAPAFAAGFLSLEDSDLVGGSKVTVLFVNIPEDTYVSFDYSGTDTGYRYDIGDTIDIMQHATVDHYVEGLDDAAIGYGFVTDQMIDHMYLYVYAVSEDGEHKVVARTTLSVSLRPGN